MVVHCVCVLLCLGSVRLRRRWNAEAHVFNTCQV